MEAMIRNAGLYGRLLGANLRSQMQYRFSFLADFFAASFGIVTEFLAVLILYQHVPALGGWSVAEVAVLYGSAELSMSLGRMLSSGFDTFPEMVRLGDFDRLLIRPAGTFLQVLAADLNLRQLGRMAQGAAVFAVGVAILDPAWGPSQWLFVAWTILGGMVFFAGLFVIGGTFAFWTVESLEAMNILTYGGSAMASYPFNIYAPWLRDVFIFVVPLAFVNFIPFRFLLHKQDALGLPPVAPFLAFPACAAVGAIAYVFWRMGVRHYQSTGH